MSILDSSSNGDLEVIYFTIHSKKVNFILLWLIIVLLYISYFEWPFSFIYQFKSCEIMTVLPRIYLV